MIVSPTPIVFYRMDTAPKDGRLLLLETAPGVIRAAYWEKEFNYVAVGEGFGYRGAWTDGSVESWGDQTNCSFPQPLRWAPMPVPAPISCQPTGAEE